MHLKNKKYRKGEVYSVNDKNIRGHKSLIIDLSKIDVDVIVFTHASRTRRIPNIILQENPDKTDVDISSGKINDTYVLPKKQHAFKKDIGKYHPEFVVKNKIDKSIIRNIKK